ncbi:MAG TPA: HEAT repeat domain-containing protein [Verrucomicrobiae bacterium]|jgi:HEAT repeat protein
MSKNLRRFWILPAAALVFLTILLIAHQYFPRYNGHSAKFWLRQVIAPNIFDPRTDNKAAAFEAFNEMGTKADAALIAGFRAKESAFHRLFARLRWSQMGQAICLKLPLRAQNVIDIYTQNYTQSLPWAAEAVVQRDDLREIAPKLLPLLEDTNWMVRVPVLGAVLYRIDPDKVTAVGLRWLSLAAQDEMPQIRLRAAICLAQAGARATNELPTIIKLCADTNANVRLAAVWALGRIGGGDVPGTTLEKALAQWAESTGTPMMGWEVYAESPQFRMDSLTDPIAIDCLTNANPNVRRNACAALARHFEGARLARNILPNLMDDPDPVVRRKARSLMEAIQQSGPEPVYH